jgi:hypothetical protein
LVEPVSCRVHLQTLLLVLVLASILPHLRHRVPLTAGAMLTALATLVARG